MGSGSGSRRSCASGGASRACSSSSRSSSETCASASSTAWTGCAGAGQTMSSTSCTGASGRASHLLFDLLDDTAVRASASGGAKSSSAGVRGVVGASEAASRARLVEASTRGAVETRLVGVNSPLVGVEAALALIVVVGGAGTSSECGCSSSACERCVAACVVLAGGVGETGLAGLGQALVVALALALGLLGETRLALVQALVVLAGLALAELTCLTGLALVLTSLAELLAGLALLVVTSLTETRLALLVLAGLTKNLLTSLALLVLLLGGVELALLTLTVVVSGSSTSSSKSCGSSSARKSGITTSVVLALNGLTLGIILLVELTLLSLELSLLTLLKLLLLLTLLSCGVDLALLGSSSTGACTTTSEKTALSVLTL